MRHPSRHQRGAAALVVTLMLFLALGLSLVHANRTLLIDNRSTRYQIQSAQAFESAEAGVAWTLAMLDDPRRLDDTCLPTSSASAGNLRDRLLGFDAATGQPIPRTWFDGSTARPVEVACVGGDEGWRCSCPSGGALHLPAAQTELPRPAFRVSLQPGARPGTVQLTSTGCNNAGPACWPASGEPSESKARVQVLLGMLPALFVPPAAPLTAVSDVATPSSVGLVNRDIASGGATADLGGSFTAPTARLTSASGSATSLSVVEGDSSLRTLPAERLFARHFGMDKAMWRQRPGVSRLTCSGNCGSRITAALAAGSSMVWVDGDLSVEEAVTWGSQANPVIVIATGGVRIDGPANITGVLYGHDIVWNDSSAATSSPSSSILRGALISESHYAGSGAPDLVYDGAVLRTLNRITGDFVRVPGSWKDF